MDSFDGRDAGLGNIRFGDFQIDVRSGELRRHGLKIKLQRKPFQILMTLLEHAGERVTREDLRQSLWPSDTYVNFDRSINIAVYKLRATLNDLADIPRYIETLPGRGYQFIGKIGADGNGAGPSKAGEGRSDGAAGEEQLPDFESVRGALPIDSPYYIERSLDAAVHRAVEGGDSVVLLKAPARQARRRSWRACSTAPAEGRLGQR